MWKAMAAMKQMEGCCLFKKKVLHLGCKHSWLVDQVILDIDKAPFNFMGGGR